MYKKTKRKRVSKHKPRLTTCTSVLPNKNDLIIYKTKESSTYQTVKILSRAGKQSGKYQKCFNILNEKDEIQCLNLEDISDWSFLNHNTKNDWKKAKACKVILKKLNINDVLNSNLNNDPMFSTLNRPHIESLLSEVITNQVSQHSTVKEPPFFYNRGWCL